MEGKNQGFITYKEFGRGIGLKLRIFLEDDNKQGFIRFLDSQGLGKNTIKGFFRRDRGSKQLLTGQAFLGWLIPLQ